MKVETVINVDLDQEETEHLMQGYRVCDRIIDWLEEPYEDRMVNVPHAENIKALAENARYALDKFMNYMGIDVNDWL